jgi:uncharacterized protein (TIGR00369 family)
MDELLIRGRAALAAQPFSALVGAALTALSLGTAELTIPLAREHRQQHGFVHGGVLGYAADNALTFAGGSVLGPAVVTAGYAISFLRPATGEALVARATVVHAGRRQAVCRCDLFDRRGGEEVLCAVAQGTITAAGDAAA